jgi:hypothetical protein
MHAWKPRKNYSQYVQSVHKEHEMKHIKSKFPGSDCGCCSNDVTFCVSYCVLVKCFYVFKVVCSSKISEHLTVIRCRHPKDNHNLKINIYSIWFLNSLHYAVDVNFIATLLLNTEYNRHKVMVSDVGYKQCMYLM